MNLFNILIIFITIGPCFTVTLSSKRLLVQLFMRFSRLKEEREIIYEEMRNYLDFYKMLLKSLRADIACLQTIYFPGIMFYCFMQHFVYHLLCRILEFNDIVTRMRIHVLFPGEFLSHHRSNKRHAFFHLQCRVH